MKSEWKTGLKAGTTADNFLKKSLSSNYFTYQQIFEMLVPLIMDQFFVSIIGLLTTAMISSSSQESVSAVSLVSPIYAMTYAIFSSISAAGTVIIAQYKGNGNMNMVKKAAGQIVMFTVASAIFFSIVLSFFAGSLIDAMFADADICVKNMQLILCPALVQGEGAAASIVHGIHALEQIGVDVIIVGRGGGSIEDLWAFNEEMVARAIFDCRIPVISAVGHQTDFTIADYVADLRAPTPSAAAELAVFDYRQAMQELLGMRQQMDKELQRKVTVARNHLEHQRMRLHYLSPQQRMNENRRRVAEYEEKLTGRMEELLRERRHRLALLAGTLESYSPVKKLSGGYAFVEDGNHQALRSIHQIREKDTVQIHLLDGTLTAAVTEIQAAEGVKNE